VSRTNYSERGPSHQAGQLWDTGQRPAFAILVLAMFLYGVSLIKFYVRDPLAAQTGLQGPIELAFVILAGLTMLAAFRRRYWRLWLAPSAKAFVAFGGIAVVSSLFSYFPLLSLLKGLSFILVCGIAAVASCAFGSIHVVKCLYYSIMIILVAGFIAKLAAGGPLLEIDDYSGRARFTLFAWHPGTLADLCALTLLSSLLLPKRPPLYCQIFLLAINVAAASRASSALLVVILLFIGLTSVQSTRRFLFLCCCMGALLTLTTLVVVEKHYQSTDSVSIGQGLYGDKLDEDLTTLSGRKEVWSVAEPLISHSVLLGYGLDGSRDVLIKNTSWAAGNTHNSLIDLILAGGFPAMLVFLLGWAAAARHAWQSRGFLRIGALGTYAYIAGFGIVSPNLTYLQGLASFLILTIDAMVCAELSLGVRVSRRYLPWIRRGATRQQAISART
jgi:hypothetical protein